jgi:hypothetical protein
MNIPLWIPWKPEEFSSFPVPCHTPYSVNNFGKGLILPTAKYATFA